MNTTFIEENVIDVAPISAPAASVASHAIARAANAAVVPSVTPSDLLRIAVEKGADLDYLERLMDLHIKFEANEAKKAFVADMSAFKSEPIEIFKRKQVGYEDRKGQFVGYKHAELSDVVEAIVPAMSRHNLSHRWDVRQEGRNITVDCIVTHALGHSEKVTMTAPPDDSGKKNIIQQVASTVTYLQRYTLLAATGMSTKGEDNDGRGADSSEEAGAQQDAVDPSYVGNLIEQAKKTTSDSEALQFWHQHKKALANKPEEYEQFKAAIQAHRTALRNTSNNKG